MLTNTVDQADDAGPDHLAELLALHRDSLPHQQTQAGHQASKPPSTKYRHLATISFYHVSSSSGTAKPQLCVHAWQFLEHSGRCYRYYDDRRSWQEARSMCQDAHKEGELASIPDR